MQISKTLDESASEANYRDLEMPEDENKMYTYTKVQTRSFPEHGIQKKKLQTVEDLQM